VKGAAIRDLQLIELTLIIEDLPPEDQFLRCNGNLRSLLALLLEFQDCGGLCYLDLKVLGGQVLDCQLDLWGGCFFHASS